MSHHPKLDGTRSPQGSSLPFGPGNQICYTRINQPIIVFCYGLPNYKQISKQMRYVVVELLEILVFVTT